jgi:hypothetical protein
VQASTPQDTNKITESSPKLCRVSVRVELFGLPTLITGSRLVVLDLPTGAMLGDVITALGARCPKLLGSVIRGDGKALMEGYSLNQNGVRFLEDVEEPLELVEGESLLLLSNQAGG